MMRCAMQIITNNEQETGFEAQKLAKTLKNGDVLCLSGDLGAGKTVFAREIIRFLIQNEAQEVPSPTFTLVQTYETPQFPVFHYDLYRLETPEDIYELGWEDSLASGVCIIEWPSRADGLIPKPYKMVQLEMVENCPEARKITVKDIT